MRARRASCNSPCASSSSAQRSALSIEGTDWSGHLAPGLRVVFCEQYAIYYLPRPNGIIIVRVLHGSRDIDSIVDEGGFAI
jgi:plasmid stabilization system protein ParE